MSIQSGGPPFPRSYSAYTHGDGSPDVTSDGEDGMSLRDWFAGKAMQGLIHDILIEQHWEDVLLKQGIKTEQFPAFLAYLSYATADAMIQMRSKPLENPCSK